MQETIGASFIQNGHIDGLKHDGRIFIALAMEILQSCTKPSTEDIWELSNISKYIQDSIDTLKLM